MTKDELTALIERIDLDDALFEKHFDAHHKALQALINLRDAMGTDTDRGEDQ